jgi:hypothetical protein
MPKNQKFAIGHNDGFALIIGLSLMAFVLLLMLSLATIMRVETKVSRTNQKQLSARENAKMGLQLALGTLQESLGPDQRISATSEILPNSHQSKKNLTGVWVSAQEGTTIGSTNYSYGDFVLWLASDATEEAYNTTEAPSTAVTLVGAGSVADKADDGTDNDFVQIVPTPVSSNDSGNYAWWIGDEGVKAAIQLPIVEENSEASTNDLKYESILLGRNYARSQIATIDSLTDKLSQSVDMSSLTSVNGLPLAYTALNKADSISNFHSLTAWSMGVLADVKNGGLKKDLSLLFELSDSQFDQSKYGADGPHRISVFGFGDTSLWSEPLFVEDNAAGPSWNLLRDYYRLYQRMQDPMNDPTLLAQDHYPSMSDMRLIHSIPTGTSAVQNANIWQEGSNSPHQISGYPIKSAYLADAGDVNAYQNRTLPYPIRLPYMPYLQRFLLELGLFRETDTATNTESVYKKLRANAIFHNPYNVKLETQEMGFNIQHIQYRLILDGNESNESLGASGGVGSTDYAPGDIRIAQLKWGGTWTPQWGNFGEWSTISKVSDPVFENLDTGSDFLVSYAPLINSQNVEKYSIWISAVIRGPSLRDGEPDESVSGVTPGQNAMNWTENDLSIFQQINGNFLVSDSKVKNTMQDTNPEAIYLPSEDEGIDENLPLSLFAFDYFIKPAAYNDQNNRYPAFALTNPAAIVATNFNLLPAPDSTQSAGWPLLAPDRIFKVTATPSSGTTIINDTWGISNDSGGNETVVMIDLPTSPPQSIGTLQNAQLTLVGHFPALAVSNSLASPYIDPTKTITTFPNVADNDRYFYDLSYLANQALWDEYYFSSYSIPYDASADDFNENNNSVSESFDAAFDPSYSGSFRAGTLPNARMQLSLISDEDIDDARTKMFSTSNEILPTAYERSAENLMVNGAFNVNSVSVDAWTAILSSARDNKVYYDNNSIDQNSKHTAISRLSQPIKGAYSGNEASDEAWAGFRTLSDEEIRTLATAIVDELRERQETVNGNRPYLSLAEFVNRSLRSDRFGRSGLLQAAIDNAGLNDDFNQTDMVVTSASLDSSTYGKFPYPDNIQDSSGDARSAAAGAPAYILQGDILTAIGSFINVRSDTFRIRAYGDYLNPITEEVEAQAWCEAIVQRVPQPVVPGNDDATDAAYWTPHTNGKQFGRKFVITHFRWLNENEI